MTSPQSPAPAQATLVAVCVVHAIRVPAGNPGPTAIDKRPVDGPVQAGPLGLAGDTQCDAGRHGGADQALYAYSEEEAQRWAGELDRPVPPGLFGENLRVRGLAVSDALIGERWQFGAQTQVEVTVPRVPCATFARHLEQPHWVRRFTDRADVGAYLRVLVPGPLAAGDVVTRCHVPDHGVTVREVFTALMNGPTDPDRLKLLLAEPTLAAKLRAKLEQLLARYDCAEGDPG